MDILLELLLHPDVQEKLYRELVECHPNDRAPYEELNKSNYLSAVVGESLWLRL